MAQHDYDLVNAAGASFRQDVNLALAAIVSNNSGVTAPATTFAYQLWADTTTGLLKIRNAANSAWITLGLLTGPQIHTIQKFTASGTYTKPAGLRAALIYVKACGGSGGGSSVLAKGGGGGEGQEGWLLVAAASISASETVTIAAAAAAINANTNANGNTGGTCSFGTLLTAAGGVGGTAGNNGGAPGLGGTGGSGADWYMAGAAGQPGGDSDGITIALNSAGGGKGGSTGTPVANSGGGGGPGGIAGASGTGATGICTVIECY